MNGATQFSHTPPGSATERSTQAAAAEQLVRQGCPAEAERTLREALSLHPHDGHAVMLLARLLLAGNRIADACIIIRSFV
ncbi:MAG: tetratricopeptide repeat protein, partial [Lysobacterales bacterium]